MHPYTHAQPHTSTSRKKFCKYCWDRGLPTTTCFSHFVKDRKGPSGVIVCPTLLNDVCMRCGICGHTPRYCASATPLLTTDYPNPSIVPSIVEIGQGLFGMFRLISYEKWIEPIPPHLRSAHTNWKISQALQRRCREMRESRYGLCHDYDADAKMDMVVCSGRWVENRVNQPYSDYELEVLAKCDVTQMLLRECFPNGYANITEPERATLRNIVACNEVIFYSLPPTPHSSDDAKDDATMNTFHASYDLTPNLDPESMLAARNAAATATTSASLPIYKSRVLHILNDLTHRRRSYNKYFN